MTNASPSSEQVTLSPSLVDALEDCAHFTKRGRLFFWKPKSMEKLASKGLVELRSDVTGQSGYWVTQRGLQLVNK